jgi:hypothetical protein
MKVEYTRRGLGDDATNAALINLLNTSGQAILRQSTPGGTYIQGADGSVYYRQPDGSNVPILGVSETLVGGKITAGTAAPFGDTSTVLIIGLGLVGVFMLVSLMKGRR